jgi:uncharacterized membrane protein YraQ (UPF0718 family)
MPDILGPSVFILWGMTAVVFAIAIRRGDGSHRRGLRRGMDIFIVNGPRVAMALLAAGFFSQILPKELVAAWLGAEAGWRAILIGCAIGPLFPGGPLVIFPVVVVLIKAGAGLPALVALLTSAGVWGVHRILAFEIPLMGTRFAANRLVASLILPPLAGFLAALLVLLAGPPAIVS